MGIYYKTIDKVDKPWLIMVHGFTQSHKVYTEQIKFFEKKYKLLLIDLRGHGKSPDNLGAYGIEEYAGDVDAVIQDLGIDSFFYWGTHTGTAVGLVLALKYKTQIKAIVSEGTVLPGFDMPRVTELLNRAKEITKKQGVEVAKLDWFEHADWFDYMREHPIECRAKGHKELVQQFRGTPWSHTLEARAVTNINVRLEELAQPMLIYNGEFDMPDFLNVAKRIGEVVRSSTVVSIPNSGAFPCWENPGEVNKVVDEFLNGHVS